MLVSVVIPTRNRRDLAARALTSVLGQTDVDLEALVVDDGSTDGTARLAEDLGDERVRHLRNETATGVALARNHGIAEAGGDWIAFLDDDDLWAPEKLRSQLVACRAADADFAYTGLVVTDTNLDWRKPVAPPAPTTLARSLLGVNVIGPPSCVMASRSLLERVGGFDPDYSILADWDLWLRLAAAGRPAACEAPLTAYVTHPENMHLDATGSREEFKRLKHKHAGLARDWGGGLGNHRLWGWIAGSYRRSGRRYRAAGLFLKTGLRYGRPEMLVRGAGLLAGDRVARGARRLLPDRRGSEAGVESAKWLDAFKSTGNQEPD